MGDPGTRQLQYELDTWKRMLLFIMGETVQLKSRLSEVLMENSEPIHLEEAEHFQNKFIKQDELIRILRNDLAELDKSLIQAKPGEFQIATLQLNLENLRTNLVNAEAAAMNLIAEFYQFLQRHYTQRDLANVKS